jgi:hypothetical protein
MQSIETLNEIYFDGNLEFILEYCTSIFPLSQEILNLVYRHLRCFLFRRLFV